eukprot:comp17183_c0_seq1/m.16057 comp17183_c0_seq1/g.16057  ORF comp17183_c0_seq1/g.16057 comp17183_c0_seq1/m.16057 type:complete len:228 (-) comp17183_c0_seq1:100-783(-)
MRLVVVAGFLGMVMAVAFAGVRGWKAFQKLKPRDLINILYFYGLIITIATRDSIIGPTEKHPHAPHGSPSISSSSLNGQPIRRGQSLPERPVAKRHAHQLSVDQATPSPKGKRSATFSALKKSVSQRGLMVVDEMEVARTKSEPTYLQVTHGVPIGTPTLVLTPPTIIKRGNKTQPASPALTNAALLESKRVGKRETLSSLEDMESNKTSGFRSLGAKIMKRAETKA